MRKAQFSLLAWFVWPVFSWLLLTADLFVHPLSGAGFGNIILFADQKPFASPVLETGLVSHSLESEGEPSGESMPEGAPAVPVVGGLQPATPLLGTALVLLGVSLSRAYWLRKQVNKRTVELQTSEARYRNLVERIPAIVYTVPLDGSEAPFYISPQVKNLLGFSPEVFQAGPQVWAQLIHPDDQPRVLAETSSIEETGIYTVEVGRKPSAVNRASGSDPQQLNLEYRAVARDGRVLWLRDEAVIVIGPDGRPLLRQGVITDITDRKETEARLHRQLQRSAALRLIDLAITSSVDIKLTLRILLDQAISLLGADAGVILLLNPETRQLEYGVGTGFTDASVEGIHLDLGQGCAGQAALHRRPVHLSGVDPASAAVSQPLEMASEGFNSYFGAPLVAKGAVKGVLELFFRSPVNSDADWMNFLEALSGQAAIAIDNAALFESLQQVNTSLMTAYDDTIQGWARALELRDGETEGHSRRVTEMVVELAKELGCSESELIHMRRGALLHDIGKMGIPDRILLKPGRLSDTEWQIMRRHPVYAYDMLASIDFLRPALEIPYCHHERWDGRGYPRGLVGEQIPLSARIFALVDVWDALRSDRPYRPAWSEEKVHQYLRREAGRQFDPHVVEAFFSYIRKNKRAWAGGERRI